MHPYPHVYVASAAGGDSGPLQTRSPDCPPIAATPPPQFGGPEGAWSPETLLCAALADCFILTFRGVARAGGLNWNQLECRVEGVLERVERVSQFTRFTTTANLSIPEGTDPAKARELLERAEQGCLVANSMRGTRTLRSEVVVQPP